MESDSFGRLLCGPVGSGKTTGSIVELFRRMGEQAPGYDGKRYTRFAIVRQTLKDAKMTVLKDIRGWFGSLADWRVSESTLYVDYGDINSEYIFIPLEEPEDIKRLLSTQLTGAFINEAVEIDINLLTDITGRCGRFPNNEFGIPTWKGIIADTNMPLQRTPWAEFILNPPPLWQVFRQPSGLSEEAENLAHLNQTTETAELDEHDPIRIRQGRGYYERLVQTGTTDYIRRFVCAEFGRDPSGSAVFAESFRYDFHVSREPLEPVYSRLLIVGQDFGRDPWSLICQMDHKGRLLVLEEVAANDIGLEQHVRRNLIPVLLQERYAGRPMVIVGDPAGEARSSLFEVNSFDLLKQMGLPAERAPTNDLTPRLRSVENFLIRQVDGGGAILFDPVRCPTVVQGMNGGYRFSKTKDDVSRSLPDKNPWSHVCDSLQYVCLIAGNMSAYSWLLGRVINQNRKVVHRKAPSALAWT
jgi:hypothetical protein